MTKDQKKFREIARVCIALSNTALTRQSFWRLDPKPGSSRSSRAHSHGCHPLKRAISRRACQTRLWRGVHIDTAENK